MPELRERIAKLRGFANEFRRIAKEYAVLDHQLAKRLNDVVAELEQEAAQLERDQTNE